MLRSTWTLQHSSESGWIPFMFGKPNQTLTTLTVPQTTSNHLEPPPTIHITPSRSNSPGGRIEGACFIRRRNTARHPYSGHEDYPGRPLIGWWSNGMDPQRVPRPRSTWNEDRQTFARYRQGCIWHVTERLTERWTLPDRHSRLEASERMSETRTPDEGTHQYLDSMGWTHDTWTKRAVQHRGKWSTRGLVTLKRSRVSRGDGALS